MDDGSKGQGVEGSTGGMTPEELDRQLEKIVFGDTPKHFMSDHMLSKPEQIKNLILGQVEARLLEKKFHGSICIDSECEDEDHGYEAVGVDTIRGVISEFRRAG